MLKVKVNNQEEFKINFSGRDFASGTVNDAPFSWDMIEIKNGEFHIIKNDKSYTAEVVRANREEKTFVIKVNGNKYTLEVKDKFDELLQSMGMDNLASAKVNELKAPMPGLVLDILTPAGTEVKKGDPVIILEAMKMENMLKSPADGVVKKIHVEKRQAVEKNQVLVSF